MHLAKTALLATLVLSSCGGLRISSGGETPEAVVSEVFALAAEDPSEAWQFVGSSASLSTEAEWTTCWHDIFAGDFTYVVTESSLVEGTPDAFVAVVIQDQLGGVVGEPLRVLARQRGTRWLWQEMWIDAAPAGPCSTEFLP